MKVGLLADDDGDDETVESEGFSEDEDEQHPDEDLLLLGVGTDSSVTDNANG